MSRPLVQPLHAPNPANRNSLALSASPGDFPPLTAQLTSHLFNLLHVRGHGLLGGHVGQVLPGAPLGLADDVPEGWRRLRTWTLGRLLEEAIQSQLHVV